MIHTQFIEIKPRAKERPRTNRKTGVTYTPKATADYEKAIAAAYTGPKFEGPVEVEVRFFDYGFSLRVQSLDDGARSKLRGDLDNYVKAVQDGLNGVAYVDDRQIVALWAEK